MLSVPDLALGMLFLATWLDLPDWLVDTAST